MNTINARELLTPDYRKLNNDFTVIVANQLHYFERMNEVDISSASAEDIRGLQTGSITRFRNDAMFNAKVKSLVAQLMQAATIEHDERVSRFGGDSGLLKIVEA